MRYVDLSPEYDDARHDSEEGAREPDALEGDYADVRLGRGYRILSR